MPDFFERAEPIFDFYLQGKYEESLRLADQLALEFPERSINTSYWRMCLLALLGRKEASLQVMEEAVSNGLWWSEARLRNEPDLIDLQGDSEFERLTAICEQRFELAKTQARPERIVLEPNVIAEHLPLLMVLHGRDGSAERERHHWELARDLGWLTVLAQSSQTGSLDAYLWDDIELAHQEIRDHFTELQAKYNLDSSRIVLGGFSQGSAVAILAALQGIIPCTSFFVVVPGRITNVDHLSELAESARGRGLHGVIVAGGKDPRFESFGQISSTLSTHGIPCQLEIRPDVGHAYPPDFRELLEKYLQNF